MKGLVTKMSRHSTGRQILYFILGSLINIAFFSLSKYLNFPFWFDFTGSFYITVLAGPILGMLSIILHTVILVFLIDGSVAMWLLLPVITVYTVISVSHTSSWSSKPNVKPVAITTMSLGALLANFIIFVCTPTLPGRYSVYNAAFSALTDSHNKVVASVIFASAISIIEIAVSMLIVILFVKLTPKPSDLTFKK